MYVIGDLSTVWVQAKVYEYEIPHVELGQPATVTIASLPERQFTGKVVFIQPTVDETTRTVQVRIELPNQEGVFKPGMFAQIAIAASDGRGLARADVGRAADGRAGHRLSRRAGRPFRARRSEDQSHASSATVIKSSTASRKANRSSPPPIS